MIRKTEKRTCHLKARPFFGFSFGLIEIAKSLNCLTRELFILSNYYILLTVTVEATEDLMRIRTDLLITLMLAFV